MPTANYVKKRAVATPRGLAGSFLEQLPMSGLAVILWLGSSAQNQRLGRNWKLGSRVGADAANFLGRKAPQYSRQRMKRMSYNGLVEAHKAVPSELVLRGGAGI